MPHVVIAALLLPALVASRSLGSPERLRLFLIRLERALGVGPGFHELDSLVKRLGPPARVDDPRYARTSTFWWQLPGGGDIHAESGDPNALSPIYSVTIANWSGPLSDLPVWRARPPLPLSTLKVDMTRNQVWRVIKRAHLAPDPNDPAPIFWMGFAFEDNRNSQFALGFGPRGLESFEWLEIEPGFETR